MLKNKIRICIIDDNEAVCKSLKFLFSSFYNIDAEIYLNPDIFIKKFSTDWQGCVFIDLFMPALNGIDVIKELKKRNCDMRLVIMSGHADDEVSVKALAVGAHDFISKPLSVEKLLIQVDFTLKLNP